MYSISNKWNSNLTQTIPYSEKRLICDRTLPIQPDMDILSEKKYMGKSYLLADINTKL